MRIAIDYTPGLAQRAGIGRYARELVAALIAAPEEQQFTLFAAAPPGRRLPAVPLHPAPRQRFWPVGDRWPARLWQRARLPLPPEWLAGPADLWHGLDFVLPPWTRLRRVVTIHDTAFWDLPECAEPRLVAYLARAVPRAARAADRVICLSEYGRAALLRHLPDLAPERVAVVPLGVSERFDSVPAPVRQRVMARLGVREPFALATGTLEPRKNYPRLIAAYARAREEPGGPRQLVIAGGPGWRASGIAAALAAHDRGDIRVVSGLTDADLAALYSAAAVFAQVSLSEGFGLPMLEAMRAGAPVVASAGGALPEVAGDAALIVPPDDVVAIAAALTRATRDMDLRDRLVMAGRARAARYTWRATAHATLRVYADAARE